MGDFNKIQFCLKHGHIPQIVLYIIPNLHVVFIIPQNFHDMRKRRMPPRVRRFFFSPRGGKEQKTAPPMREGLSLFYRTIICSMTAPMGASIVRFAPVERWVCPLLMTTRFLPLK